MIVNEYDEKEFFDKSIKMLEKDYGNSFANDFKDIYIKQQKEIERLKKREQECIEHYQVALKYANEMEERIIKAMHYVDQVLGYHLNSGYEQLDKDCNELFGILRWVDKE